MKKLFTALLVLGSFSTFAGTFKVICETGHNGTGEPLKPAVAVAEHRLNNRLAELADVKTVSDSTMTVTKDEKFDLHEVAICVTVEQK